jgi:hypothetical protein
MMPPFIHPAFLMSMLIWLAAAWIIGQLGRNKRFGFLGNFLIAFIFSPVVGVLVLLASDDRRQRS